MTRVRLDKWLWAARFFKTRTQAAEAVTGGHVHVGGARVKPGREIKTGENLAIRKGAFTFLVTVRALSERRGPAKEAILLYEESAESVENREAVAALKRMEALARPIPGGRPTKRARREATRIKSRSGGRSEED